MRIKKVSFSSKAKKWDGICFKAQLFENFILYFLQFKVEEINKRSVKRYIRRKSSCTNRFNNHLEIIFSYLSKLLERLKHREKDEKISFLPQGGGRIKFVTNNSWFSFLDHLENILIELIFT